jgi:hypothetical protein
MDVVSAYELAASYQRAHARVARDSIVVAGRAERSKESESETRVIPVGELTNFATRGGGTSVAT